MTRLLITGGAGFIGANFVHHWLARQPGDRVVVLDSLTYAGNRANLASAGRNPQLRFVLGDIRDTALVERLLTEERLDTLVHFAAESHVDRSIEEPDAFLETNILGTHSLLKAARRCWLASGTGLAGGISRAHRFHHVSTDEVYGSLGPEDDAFTETTPYAPNSPYSASKAASDHLVRAYHHTYGLQTTISNCSNNYGPFQFPEKLIPLMIGRLAAGQPLPVYGDGRNIRDWLHVEDHCRGIAAILERGKPGETYNIGGRAEGENLHLVHILCDLVDDHFASHPSLLADFPGSAAARGFTSRQLVTFVSDRPGHDRRYAIDSSKLHGECGFFPEVTLESGLRATIGWYLDRAETLAAGWKRTA
jgi:dTDP-glucose 4,6-dehydratase